MYLCCTVAQKHVYMYRMHKYYLHILCYPIAGTVFHKIRTDYEKNHQDLLPGGGGGSKDARQGAQRRLHRVPQHDTLSPSSELPALFPPPDGATARSGGGVGCDVDSGLGADEEVSDQALTALERKVKGWLCEESEVNPNTARATAQPRVTRLRRAEIAEVRYYRHGLFVFVFSHNI